MRIYVVVSGPLRNNNFVPLVFVSGSVNWPQLRTNTCTNTLLRSIPVFLDVTLPNIVRFPRSLEASRRKDHVVSEVITHVKFVCKNLSD